MSIQRHTMKGFQPAGYPPPLFVPHKRGPYVLYRDHCATLSLQEARIKELEGQNKQMREVLLRASRDVLHADVCHSIAQGPYIDVVYNDVPCDCGLDELCDSIESQALSPEGERK